MLQEQLDRTYRLVGEIATEFNGIEQLWYLIFTALVHPTPRSAVNEHWQKNIRTPMRRPETVTDEGFFLLKSAHGP
jgi:hypothetical protein